MSKYMSKLSLLFVFKVYHKAFRAHISLSENDSKKFVICCIQIVDAERKKNIE